MMVLAGARAALVQHFAAVFELGSIEVSIVERLLERATSVRREPALTGRELLGEALGRDPRALAALDPAGPLFRFQIVTVTGSGAWLDREVALADDFWPRFLEHWPRSVPRARAPERELLGSLVLAPELRTQAEHAARAGSRDPAIVIVGGIQGSGRKALARAIVGQRAHAVLEVGGRALVPADVVLILRELRWQRATAVIADADLAPPAVLAAVLDGVAELGELRAVLTAPPGWIPSSPPRSAAVVHVDIATATPTVRVALWNHLLAAERAPRGVPVETVATRYRLGAARIQAIARRLAGRSVPPSSDELAELCRDATAAAFDGLARRLPLTFAADDLIVPARLRRELALAITWGRRASALFGEGGLGHRARATQGLTCLFHGPPGTGKTMAAQVIARELGIALYRVDLSQLVDKYVGETEKRLDRLFREADDAGCALLFDEADAVFTRRGEVREARDRYANLETSFLLQRLEEHGGLCFLTSNLQRGIDNAFFRRFGLIVEFPLPARTERRAIWDALLPLDRAPDISLDYLADRFILSGGDIRSAVVAGVLLADSDGAPLAMEHLVAASWRELQKAGRLVDPRELGPWQQAVARFAASGRT